MEIRPQENLLRNRASDPWPVSGIVHDFEVAWSECDNGRATSRKPQTGRSKDGQAVMCLYLRDGAIDRRQGPFEEVGLTDELGHEARAWSPVDFPRRSGLRDVAGAHHENSVGHRKRLFLVMRDEDKGNAQLALQRLQLDLHLLAQTPVQRGKRFIQKKKLGPSHQCARQGDALALTTGELRGLARSEIGKPHQVKRLLDTRLSLGRGCTRDLEGIADITLDTHMREKRIGLENGVHGPAIGRCVRDITAIQNDAARVQRLEPGNRTKKGRLAATRRPKKSHEFSRRHFQIDPAESGDSAALGGIEASFRATDAKQGLRHLRVCSLRGSHTVPCAVVNAQGRSKILEHLKPRHRLGTEIDVRVILYVVWRQVAGG